MQPRSLVDGANRRFKSVQLRFIVIVASVCAPSCGGTQVAPDDHDSWRHKGLWVENHNDAALINVVGRAENASMGETFVFSSAESDARARLALYLKTTAKAFRSRLARVMAVKGKNADGDTSGAFQTSEDIKQGDVQLADRAVAGMETIESFTDEKSDTFYVLGRVNMDALQQFLVQENGLTDQERSFVEKNSEVVKSEWAAASAEGKAEATR